MKRVFAALLAFMMVISFTACNKGSDKDGAENEKNNGANAVAGYVGIEATNDEGKIIAAADRTVFGSSGLAVEVEEDGYTLFEGSISFADILALSGLYIDIDNGEIYVVANNGEAVAYSEEEQERILFNISEILSPTSSEFDGFLTELTGKGIDEWISILSQAGIKVDFAKVSGWVKNIVNGSINEDVVAEIFDTVAIPYFVYMLNSEGANLTAKDIPDYKTLKAVIYDFFLDGHASSALEIENNGDEYEVTVYFRELAENVLDYIKNHKDLQKLLNSQIGQYFIEEMEEEVDYIDSYESFTFTVEITDGYITHFEVYDFEISIADVNNTKDDYDAIIKKTEDYDCIGEIEDLDDAASKI